MVGQAKANALFSGAIHLLSAGSSDFVQNYYVNPAINPYYTADQFSDILINSYTNFVQVSLMLNTRLIFFFPFFCLLCFEEISSKPCMSMEHR